MASDPLAARRWLVDLVRFYRPMGFFPEFGDLTDEEAADRLTDRDPGWVEGWTPEDPAFDLRFIGDERFWSKDTEYGEAFRDQGFYVEALREWAAISRGAFQPEGIEETWKGDEGPITVEFTLQGKRHMVRPEYLEDYIDHRILQPINKMIERTGTQFYEVPTGDQTVMIVALTDDERRRIQDARGLRFYKAPLREADLGDTEG